MDKKYLIPAYIRRNVTLNWQLRNKPKTRKNSYWICALANILLAGFFLGFGELLTKDLPRDIAAYTTMCLFGILAMFITTEVFEITGDDDE